MNLMYNSTRNKQETATASQAILKGLATDGGLFVPESIPALDKDIATLANMSYQEVAYEVMKLYITDFTEEELKNIDKSLLIKLFLNLQNQMETLTAKMKALNDKMQKMMEQLVLANNNRFGRKTEKMSDTNQIYFIEVNGKIVLFNEAFHIELYGFHVIQSVYH